MRQGEQEIRRAITDDMRKNGGKPRIFDDWQKLMICLKARLSAQKRGGESVFGRDLATDALITNGVKSLPSIVELKVLMVPAGFHSMIRALQNQERCSCYIINVARDAISHGVRGAKLMQQELTISEGTQLHKM